LVVVVAFVNPAVLPAALPWLLAWILSPTIAYWVSRPLPERDPPLSVTDRAELRRTARKTWRVFEKFVTEEDHRLPPGNYQEDPKGELAHRTSPTNMGLLVLSTLSAHDLGYLTLPALAERLGKTFDTFDKLEKYRGHFLNWYETSNLKVLAPGYVSTVDSGNLLACLLVLKNGLSDKESEPIPGPAALDGLMDALNLAAEALPKGSADELQAYLAAVSGDAPIGTALRGVSKAPRGVAGPERHGGRSLQAWNEWLAEAEELAGKLPSGPEIWSKAVGEHVRALRAELAAVCPWVAVLSKPMAALSRSPTREARAEANGPVLGIPNHTPNGPPAPSLGASGSGLFPVRTEDAWAALLNELDTPAGVHRWAERLPVLQAELAGWAKGKPASGHEADAEALAEALARSKAADLALALEGLARRANAFADAMDFVFLYNATRNLFAIGYNVPLERLDPAHYDLLASEAAIASFLAVARGVVPRKHWF